MEDLRPPEHLLACKKKKKKEKEKKRKRKRKKKSDPI